MIVYLIRNTANGMCYVGKTTRSLAHRWRQHRCEARLGRKDTPLYQAMRTFQLHCFEVEVLGEADRQRSLAAMERKFIRIFNSVENGYNVNALSTGARTVYTRGSKGRPMTEENRLKIAAGFRRALESRKAA